MLHTVQTQIKKTIHTPKSLQLTCWRGGDTCIQKGFRMHSLIPVSMFGSGLILAAARTVLRAFTDLKKKKKKFKKDLKTYNEVSL